MAQTSPQNGRPVELTIRGLILGVAITLVFTAANVFLGLKVGLTFASSIPAAVISMAVLRFFKNSTIEENNIVQTVASAAGTLSSIIFVLPGLVMVGWWTNFPFWTSFGICAVGGILGVMYTVPLRRAMVVDSPLPYPEGVAAAEVLKVGAGGQSGTQKETQAGLLSVISGSIISAGFYLVVNMRLFADQLVAYFRFGGAVTGCGSGLSFALLGVGHLVGLSVGLAILVGLVIGWGIATPILTMLHPAAGAAADVGPMVWKTQVRFIGAGTIGVAALWTLAKMVKPIWLGLLSAVRQAFHSRAATGPLPRTDQDIPITYVAGICLIAIAPIVVLLVGFISGTPLQDKVIPLTIAGVVYVVLAGFLVAAICGYMAGLIGSSNSPLSGVGILAVIGAAIVMMLIAQVGPGSGISAPLVAFSLFVTSIVFSVATISNDNLQDLKTGQLVDATPWRQQASLVVGVIAGALIIPPILDLLNRAWGFAGSPHVAAVSSQPLPAPQATLISALARGVLEGKLEWGLIGTGALAGVLLIILDESLGLAGKLRLPPLSIGIGIYLPLTTTTPIILGAIIGWLYDRWVGGKPYGEIAKRLGVLLASGLIVGESLCGVLMAGLIVGTQHDAPIAVVGDNFASASMVLGGVVFVIVIVAMYSGIRRLAARVAGGR
jgi:putative OPT family oligopeptide transporter